MKRNSKRQPLFFQWFLFLLLAAGGCSPQPAATVHSTESTTDSPAAAADLFIKDSPMKNDELTAVFQKQPGLRRLTLRRLPNITDYRILPPLSHLALIEMNLSEQAVLQIVGSQKNLTSLDLRNSSGLKAKDYELLLELKTLRDLKIGGGAVDDAVLEKIAAIPNLTGLTIDDSFITEEGFVKFAKNSKSAAALKTLVFSRDTAILDDSLLHIRQFPNLERLTACDLMITGEFLAKLAKSGAARPKLKRLSLRKTLLTAEYAAALKNYPELKTLDISGNGIDEETAEIVVSLKNLQEVDLRDCQPSEAVLKLFKNTPLKLTLGETERK